MENLRAESVRVAEKGEVFVCVRSYEEITEYYRTTSNEEDYDFRVYQALELGNSMKGELLELKLVTPRLIGDIVEKINIARGFINLVFVPVTDPEEIRDLNYYSLLN